MCGENSSPSVRFSFYAPLLISRSLSPFALRFPFHAPPLISRSAIHFTLLFAFHTPLLISRSASHFTPPSHLTLRFSFHPPPPSHFTLHFSFHVLFLISRPLLISRSPSHFTLPFSFYAPRLISRPSTDFMFLPRPEYMERASPFKEKICSSNVVLCVL